MKEVLSRVSVPGRIFDLLWSDDEFYRDVSGSKKVSSSGKFPRCDQWCDESGFHMAFALAGYSPSDVTVESEGNMLHVSGAGSKSSSAHDVAKDKEDEYPAKTPSLGVQQGMIVRGIARRNFKSKYYVHPGFDLLQMSATMKDGLLEIFVPRSGAMERTSVDIEEK